jgi:hypothetical protein
VLLPIGRYRSGPAARQPETPTGIATGIGAVAIIAAGVVAAMIPAAYPGWRFGVIAAAVLVFAAVSLDQVALGIVALLGVLIFNGFLEDRLGQLAWHADDLWRLLLLIMIGALGLAVGEGYRFVNDRRARYRVADSVALFAPSQEEEKHGA